MLILLWIAFIVVVLVLMALDLGLLHREAHVIGIREAMVRTGGWVGLALAFNVLVYFMYQYNWLDVGQHMTDADGKDIIISGKQAAMEFFTGYLFEQTLSMDNMMVFAMIFVYFRVPLAQQHRVLFWGVLGAFVLRGLMIAAGAALIDRFEWVVYIFGALLIYTAIKMLLSNSDDIHPDRNLMVRAARRLYPVTPEFHGSDFFVVGQGGGKRAMTPLFLALILVSTADAVFAIDSIPAIFGITHDPFIVFTSNVFAVLGLRSLYFALAGMIEKFRYLKPSLIVLLGFIGMTMMLTHYVHVSTPISLGIIVAILGGGILASIVMDRRAVSEATK
jgi:tellurite resistance protein TerC